MMLPGQMLKQVLSSIFRKPATSRYPFVKAEQFKDFRGRLLYESAKCIGCNMCMRDCPSGAITIKKVGDKRFECVVDYDRCIYCGQCAESCNKDAIVMSGEFELAQLDKSKFKVKFDARPE